MEDTYATIVVRQPASTVMGEDVGMLFEKLLHDLSALGCIAHIKKSVGKTNLPSHFEEISKIDLDFDPPADFDQIWEDDDREWRSKIKGGQSGKQDEIKRGK